MRFARRTRNGGVISREVFLGMKPVVPFDSPFESRAIDKAVWERLYGPQTRSGLVERLAR